MVADGAQIGADSTEFYREFEGVGGASGGGSGGCDGVGPPAGGGAGAGDEVEVQVSRSRYPNYTQHVEDAQAAGHPSTLTIDRPGAVARRLQSLAGIPKVPGMQLDEYPPAMFEEGGEGASVRAMPGRENMGAGASTGRQLAGHPNGTRVRIVVVPEGIRNEY